MAVLLKPFIALAPTSVLFCGSCILFARRRVAGVFLQLAGAGCLMLVVLAHFFEALRVLTWLGWGSPNSAGHYLDLGAAIAGVALFTAGYLHYALTARKT